MRLRPDESEIHNSLGVALVHQGKHQEAEAAFREAVRLNPASAEAHYNLGVRLASQGKVGEAEACFEKAVRLKPDFAEALTNWGVALNRRGLHREAEAHLREAIRLKPDYVEAHLRLWTALRGQGKHREAEAVCREAIRLAPGSAQAHVKLGAILADQQKWPEAIAAFEEAIRLKPDVLPALTELAKLLTTCPQTELRNPCRAVELARKATQLNPQSDWAWQMLGWAEYRMGNWKASIEALEKSRKLQANRVGDEWQWLFLAMAHWQLGRQDDARRWYYRSVLYMEKHRIKASEPQQFRAEAEALLGETPLGRARGHAARKEWDQAATHYAQVLAVWPRDPEWDEWRKQLAAELTGSPELVSRLAELRPIDADLWKPAPPAQAGLQEKR
jgi:tetratricopeptide (TPR) repeat protein